MEHPLLGPHCGGGAGSSECDVHFLPNTWQCILLRRCRSTLSEHRLLWPYCNALTYFFALQCCWQVSEHSSWSIAYYGRIVEAALAAAGAPPGLVRFVTGYGDAGHALVTGGVDKVGWLCCVRVANMAMQNMLYSRVVLMR